MYFNKKKCHKLVSIFFLGFLSGLPLALSASTFRVWLTEVGINISLIGYLSMVAAPYSLKFLWAPIIDYYSIPILSSFLGRRKSWLFAVQIFLSLSILILGYIDPNEQLLYFAIIATIMTFFAASQDIIIDAYRIETLHEKQQGFGVSIFIYGYRIGMLSSGAGALLLSQYLSWSEIYGFGALIILIGALINLIFLKEPDVKKIMIENSGGFFLMLKKIISDPLFDFTKKFNWQIILLFIIFFKLGDAMAGIMTENFLINIGFDKLSIAKIVKTFGLISTLFGSFCGGIMIYRFGMIKSLWICGICQLLTNGLFVLQAIIGASHLLLTITIGAENFASGMGTAVFVAYLGSICSSNFTASQYALLNSIAPLGRIFLSAPSGSLVEHFGWVIFFSLTMIAAIPGLVFLFMINKSFKKKDNIINIKN